MSYYAGIAQTLVVMAARHHCIIGRVTFKVDAIPPWWASNPTAFDPSEEAIKRLAKELRDE